MNANKLIKSSPLLLILFIIIILNICNQKEYTKLKILIWNSPLLSLGTYLSISSGTGFILSYIFTTKLVKYNYSKPKSEIKYKDKNKINDPDEFNESNQQISYSNTLIERDIKDPSPTLNASFRVISNKNVRNKKQKSNSNIESNNQEYNDESDYIYSRQEINHKHSNEIDTKTIDWEDDTYIDW